MRQIAISPAMSRPLRGRSVHSRRKNELTVSLFRREHRIGAMHGRAFRSSPSAEVYDAIASRLGNRLIRQYLAKQRPSLATVRLRSPGA